MTVTNGNIPIINRKAWQMMTPAPANSAAGSFLVTDKSGTSGNILYVNNATVHYGYSAQDDGWEQIPSMALAGTFGAGACGTYHNSSNTVTANGGTTSTITTAASISGVLKGRTIRFLTGSQAGKTVTVTDAVINPGGTSTIMFTPALSGAIANNDTFVADTGRFYIMNAGTTAAGIFKSFDILTGTVTSLGTTNLPASWGTDGKMICTPSIVRTFASGTATSATSTTLVNSAKTWTDDKWINYQVRITAGTGIGQIRTITDNDATSLTVAAWTITPDATSQYAIEGNDDFIYLLGNNAVTMYRYSISGNTWTVMTPTTARAGAPILGMSANWISNSGNTTWANESTIQDGRYIYSFRGGTAVLDRYDIAGGTAGAGAWAAITYKYAQEVFGGGSAYDTLGSTIYIRKDATNRFFKYDAVTNAIYPFSTIPYTDGAAVAGDKIWTQRRTDGVTSIDWVHSLMNTGAIHHRCMIF